MTLQPRTRTVLEFTAYLDSVQGYAKNRYRMADDTRRRVEQAWAPYVARWGDPIPATR